MFDTSIDLNLESPLHQTQGASFLSSQIGTENVTPISILARMSFNISRSILSRQTRTCLINVMILVSLTPAAQSTLCTGDVASS